MEIYTTTMDAIGQLMQGQQLRSGSRLSKSGTYLHKVQIKLYSVACHFILFNISSVISVNIRTIARFIILLRTLHRLGCLELRHRHADYKYLNERTSQGAILVAFPGPVFDSSRVLMASGMQHKYRT
jgi:hypothetical protein